MNSLFTFVSDYSLLMTEKQEKILNAALELFATEGYTATSTSKVAKAAGVSEGLIFRHFENKEGLLKALIAAGEERMKMLFGSVLMETDPKSLIKKTIDLPFSVAPSEYDFWKLQFKLKWELEHDHKDKMEPIRRALTHAFTELEYENPALEARLIELLLDALSSTMVKGHLDGLDGLQSFLYKKYDL